MPVGNVEVPRKAYTMKTVGYDYRFGGLMVVVENPNGQQVGAFVIPVLDLMRNGYIAPHELRALIKEGEEPATNLPDHETARRQMIVECDWQGKTCLDLAGYDGSMAKLAVEHGASKALVVDSEQWRIYGWKQPDPIPGVEFIKSDLYDWHKPADIVIWYNCLYHLADPMRALTHIRSLTREKMLLCSLFRYHDGPWLYVYEPRECNSTDPSVYFGPSIAALERMLKLTGWNYRMTGKAMDRVTYECTPIPNFVDAETVEVRRVSNYGVGR